MSNSERLKRQLHNIYALTWAQKGSRLGLRSLWLGMAGTMLGWGVHTIWGWLPNPFTWFLVGLIFALFPAIAFITSFSMPSRWIWKMDQNLDLHHQLSTAWEIIHPARGKAKQDGLISDLLVEDAQANLPHIRNLALQGGWFHEIDLAASVIILTLMCTLLASLLIRPRPEQSDVPNQQIPITAPTQAPDQAQTTPTPASAGQQSSGQGQQPSGSQGAGSDQPGQNQGDNQAQGNQNGKNNSTGAPNPDMNGVADALRKLGSELSKQAGTYALGQALQNMDLNGAANALDDLKNQLKDLSPDSQNKLSQALQNTANALNQAGAQALANDMNNAASALSGGDPQAGQSQALGQVANDLRQMDRGQLAGGPAGSGIGSGNTPQNGNPEPLSRLPNENGDFSLPGNDSPQSGLLSPAPSDAQGQGTASGSLDSTYQAGNNTSQTPILPNSFPWKWRDVVSQYFQR